MGSVGEGFLRVLVIAVIFFSVIFDSELLCRYLSGTMPKIFTNSFQQQIPFFTKIHYINKHYFRICSYIFFALVEFDMTKIISFVLKR